MTHFPIVTEDNNGSARLATGFPDFHLRVLPANIYGQMRAKEGRGITKDMYVNKFTKPSCTNLLRAFSFWICRNLSERKEEVSFLSKVDPLNAKSPCGSL